MANLTQTAANVAIGARTTKTQTVQVGEAVTQGQPLFRDSSNSKWYQCDANDGISKARCGAIALTAAGADGFALVAIPSGTTGQSLVNLGATLVVGQVYCVSATKGAIAPYADLTTGDYVTILGVARSASLLDFQVTISDAQKPA